jgi:hypothetical protein
MGSHYYIIYIYYWVIIILHLKITITQALLGYDCPRGPLQTGHLHHPVLCCEVFYRRRNFYGYKPNIMDIYIYTLDYTSIQMYSVHYVFVIHTELTVLCLSIDLSIYLISIDLSLCLSVRPYVCTSNKCEIIWNTQLGYNPVWLGAKEGWAPVPSNMIKLTSWAWDRNDNYLKRKIFIHNDIMNNLFTRASVREYSWQFLVRPFPLKPWGER